VFSKAVSTATVFSSATRLAMIQLVHQSVEGATRPWVREADVPATREVRDRGGRRGHQ
jgi:murein tripeptide amidase MpaA